MKRLRDLESPTPLLAKAQLLIGSLNALPESPERMWRIRRELDRPRQALSWSAQLRRMPAVAGAGAVVLFGASAFAAVRLFAPVTGNPPSIEVAPQPAAAGPAKPRAELPSPTPTVATAATAASPAQLASAAPTPVTAPTNHPIDPEITWHHHHASARSRIRAHAQARAERKRAAHHARALRGRTLQPAISAPASAPLDDLEVAADDQKEVTAEPEVAAVPGRPQPQAQAVQPEVQAATHESTARAVPAAAAATATDSELVHRATKALRHDHDPVLAARLLAQQRERNPGGPLAQEALALQVEAAVQSHDARARSFAREYLARYPNGRYRSVAEHALSEPAP